MTKTRVRILSACCIVIAFVALAKVSTAQQSAVGADFFANAHAKGVPDGTLRISNTGITRQHLCAMIYVFTPDQQMAECCGCNESPNNLNTLSLNTDLTSNPLTGVKPTAGTIDVVSSTVNGASCDPTTGVSLVVGGLITLICGWQLGPVDQLVWTCVPDFLVGPDPLPLVTALQAQCSFINILGSGHGTCTCGSTG